MNQRAILTALALFEAARSGDEDAIEALVDPDDIRDIAGGMVQLVSALVDLLAAERNCTPDAVAAGLRRAALAVECEPGA